MHSKPDKHPELTGKYEVTQLKIGQQVLYRTSCADSLLTVVYFDIRNAFFIYSFYEQYRVIP